MSHGRSYTGHPRAHVGFSHSRLPPQHVLPPGPQFTLPGGPVKMPTPQSRRTHLVTPTPWHSHAQPTLMTQEGPCLAPLPTRHLHSDASQSSGAQLITYPKSSTSLASLVPSSRGHQVPAPFLLSLWPVISHLALVQLVTPPPVLSGSHLFKMQIWYVTPYLKPFSGFLSPQAKACCNCPGS